MKMGEAAAGEPPRPGARWLIPASFAFALALRLLGLGGSSMWMDEIMETLMARDGLRALFSSLLFDKAQPPIEPLLTWVLLALDQGELARRLCYAVIGAATVALFARWVARRFDLPTAVLTALLLASSPVLVRFSHELRPYALALLFSAWALDAAERWLERGARRFPLELVAAAALAALTHYLAVAIWLPIAVAWLEARLVGRAAPLGLRAPAAVACAALPLVTWFALLAVYGGPHQESTAARWEWSLVEQRFEDLLLRGYVGQPIPSGAAVLFALLGVIGVGSLARRRGGLALISGLVAGTALVEAALLAAQRFSNLRYNQYGLVFLLTAIAVGIVAVARQVSRWSQRTGIAVAVLLATAALASSVNGVVGYARRGRPDWPAVARAVTALAGPEARVIASHPWTQIPIGYYLGRYRNWPEEPAGVPTVYNDRGRLRREIARQSASCVLVLEGGYPRQEHLLDGLRPRQPVLVLGETFGVRLYRFAPRGVPRRDCLPPPDFEVVPSRGYGSLLPWLAP